MLELEASASGGRAEPDVRHREADDRSADERHQQQPGAQAAALREQQRVQDGGRSGAGERADQLRHRMAVGGLSGDPQITVERRIRTALHTADHTTEHGRAGRRLPVGGPIEQAQQIVDRDRPTARAADEQIEPEPDAGTEQDQHAHRCSPAAGRVSSWWPTRLPTNRSGMAICPMRSIVASATANMANTAKSTIWPETVPYGAR